MPSTLWTPDRDIPLHTRDVQEISPAEMKVFQDLHSIAQRLSIEIRCPRCNQSFRGLNDAKGREHSIFCGCREIKSVVGGRLVPD